jgi:DNA-binding transcriptional regulator/RsmH inhibitor MraZ
MNEEKNVIAKKIDISPLMNGEDLDKCIIQVINDTNIKIYSKDVYAKFIERLIELEHDSKSLEEKKKYLKWRRIICSRAKECLIDKHLQIKLPQNFQDVPITITKNENNIDIKK